MGIFAERWKQARRGNPQEEQAYWDIRADEFDSVTKNRERGDANPLVAYLKSKDALTADASVLDIGCGTGRYALEFAPLVKRVVGLDISPGMTARGKRNAEEAGFSNTEFLTVPWQAADLAALGMDKAFTLAFASMSPAIDSPASLLKMMEASTRYCFMSGFTERHDRVGALLMERLFPEAEEPAPPADVYFAFNVLWENGIRAELSYQDGGWQKELETGIAAKIYAARFAALVPEAENGAGELEKRILAALRREETDGHIVQTVSATIGRLFWKVQRPGTL